MRKPRTIVPALELPSHSFHSRTPANHTSNPVPPDIKVRDNIALVAAVGRKMTFRPGISGRLFQALGREGVNIRTIAQGADELSIIVGVENEQFETAIRVMYDGFAG